MTMSPDYIVEAKNLKIYFKHKQQIIKAVDGVDIFLQRGLTTGLAGESGCGKSTLAKAILGFYQPQDGHIYFDNRDIGQRKNRVLLRKNIQIVFQNPFSSLDPRYTVFQSLYEVLTVFQSLRPKQAEEIVAAKLSEVELSPAVMKRYPHQLSGGQNQRVAIARSLANNPSVVILDEPTSNLDVTTAVKIIGLLMKLQERHKSTFLFISHNIKLLRKFSHFCFIMYCGKIMEYGPRELIYNNPLHPYTQLLKEAAQHKLKYLGDNSSPAAACPFLARCNRKQDSCSHFPSLKEVEPGHFVFCHLY